MIILDLKKIVDGFIIWTKNDYVTKVDKTTSWLYRTFYRQSTPTYKVYNNLVDILIREDNNPRKLETRLMFDPSRAELPTIHIHMPSEEPLNGDMLGYSPDDIEELSGGYGSEIYKKFFGANYDIIVTSNNQMEVLLIYEFLKYIFIAGKDTLNHNFNKFNFSGKELMYDNNLMPNIFFRAFSINIEEKIEVPSILSQISVTGIEIEGNFEIKNESLGWKKYIVNFVVTDGISPVEGARIDFPDLFIATNINGEVDIELYRSVYNYTVSKEGFEDYVGQIVLQGTPYEVTENITLIEIES